MSPVRPKIALLGAGRFANALLAVLAPSAPALTAWARRPAARRALQKAHPWISLAESPAEACDDAELVIFAIPASGLREVASAYGAVARGDQLVVHGTRGVEPGFRLPHQILREETCVRFIAALGGPLHLPDLALGRPVSLVAGCRFDHVIDRLSAFTTGTPARVHGSRDLVGVEVAGAVSNASLIAGGIAAALELGETAKGLLLTRGLDEARRLGVALGATAETFNGLAGVGDLIPREVTSARRHHRLAKALAAGTPAKDALAGIKGDIEGVEVARSAAALGATLDLELPLLGALASILSGEVGAAEAIDGLLRLDLNLGAPA